MQSIEAKRTYKTTLNCAIRIFKDESILGVLVGGSTKADEAISERGDCFCHVSSASIPDLSLCSDSTWLAFPISRSYH